MVASQWIISYRLHCLLISGRFSNPIFFSPGGPTTSSVGYGIVELLFFFVLKGRREPVLKIGETVKFLRNAKEDPKLMSAAVRRNGGPGTGQTSHQGTKRPKIIPVLVRSLG